MMTWLRHLLLKDPLSVDASALKNEYSAESAVRPDCVDQHAQVMRLVGIFLVIGAFARSVRYYLCFPLWDDECFLCVNFISRSCAELLRPLDYHQVAPVLFLWIERMSISFLGVSEYALRLIPFVSSIVSLFLFRSVTRKLLSPLAMLSAFAVFAVSYSGIRYAAEAKPYCTDLLSSLVMLLIVIEWQQTRAVWKLGLLAGLMPCLLGLSYPAVFAAGGFSLVVGGVLYWQRGTRSEWIAWTIWNACLVVSFLFWFSVVGRIQSGAEAEFMGEYWKVNFPPIHQPWLVPYWLLKTHASDFLAYPVGGPNWASSWTLVVSLAGLWRLIRAKQFFVLGLLLGPLCLHFVAAALQKYPYGGHVKFSQYHAAMICCLVGVGSVQLIEWFSRLGLPSRYGFALSCVMLLLAGGGSVVRDLTNPYKTRSDYRARAFAQSFWPGVHSAEEVICLKGDLGLDFVPAQHVELSWSAHYRCNRAIEISRSSLQPANLDRVSAERPLRCVLYRDARFELDQALLDDWLAEMQVSYELIAHESLPFPRYAKDERKLLTIEYVDSYKFIPRDQQASANLPLAAGLEKLKH